LDNAALTALLPEFTATPLDQALRQALSMENTH